MLPVAAYAQMALKTPMSYSLQEYGIVLAISLLGGIASWFAKVRRGEVMAWNIAALIGELCVSAFAGLMAFFICEFFNLNPMLTPAIVGMSGHAGAKGLTWLESAGQRLIEKRFGIGLKDGS